ncbi:MAG TPA: VOC family protein [Thermoanaerobaculia bacterium]|nr:VOC family protein [Thermoanaerobaculia bacterium]
MSAPVSSEPTPGTSVTSPIPYGKPPRGYRLPDATRLGRVVLQVADLARSIAYYEQILGLRVLERSGNTATLGGHGDDRPFLELREHPGAAPVPRRGRLGLYHFAILLPDRAALGRFLAHLGGIGAYAGMADHLVSEALYLTDPDGLGIEVYADRPRDSWRTRGQELVMTTDPLNVEDLVAAGGGAPWTGAPAGTVLGHVHLYVDSLETAAAFYHQGLGLDETVWSYPGALFFSAGGYHHHLGTNTWAQGAVSAGKDEARLIEWEILVPGEADAAAALASLAAAGAAVETTSEGGIAHDPWGVGIHFRAVGDKEERP